MPLHEDFSAWVPLEGPVWESHWLFCDWRLTRDSNYPRLQLLTQLYLPHQRDSYHNCRADWILTYPQPQIVCVSKNGSHRLRVFPWSQKIILQNNFWSTRAHKFKIGKPLTPPFLSHSKNLCQPLDPTLITKPRKQKVEYFMGLIFRCVMIINYNSLIFLFNRWHCLWQKCIPEVYCSRQS